MCVIIYVPKESKIEMSEIENAWTTNPHGAGYSIQKDGKVYFKRGFMNLKDYKNEIKQLIGVYNLLLHFRISTSKDVNKMQTHPYKKGNVTLTEGLTQKPVICMNGIISGQKEYLDCNDTMSYIIDHESAFARVNQDILNIIEKSTGAKWAVMKPDEVLLSSKFTKLNGRYYSNQNHLWRSYTTYYYGGKKGKKFQFEELVRNKRLRASIKRDNGLYNDLLDFIDDFCNSTQGYCSQCTKCLKSAKTLRDIKIILDENYYFLEDYFDFYEYNEDEKEAFLDTYLYNDEYYEEEEEEENICCLDDFFREDTYYYKRDNSCFYDIFDE